jgi:hypothetical protein
MAVPEPAFDFVKFDEVLRDQFALALNPLKLSHVLLEQIKNAHERAVVHALLAAAPPGLVT